MKTNEGPLFEYGLIRESSWKGKLEPFGFKEHLVSQAPPPPDDAPQSAGQYWADFMAALAEALRTPTIDQLSTVVEPIFASMLEGAAYCEPQLREILGSVEPDVIVQDNVAAFPALLTNGAPWVKIVSCNPLEVKDPGIAPVFSGYPDADRSGWDEFRAAYARTHRDTWERFNAFVVDSGAPPVPDLEFVHESDPLNMYVFPEALDYRRERPLAPTWHRLESSVRETDEPFEVPDTYGSKEEPSAPLPLGTTITRIKAGERQLLLADAEARRWRS